MKLRFGQFNINSIAMNFRWLAILIFVSIVLFQSCKKTFTDPEKDTLVPKNDLVLTTDALITNLLSSSTSIESAKPGSVSASIPFTLINDSLPGVLGQQMFNWEYDDTRSEIAPPVKTGMLVRNGYVIEELPYILGDKTKIDSFKVARRGYMEFDSYFMWSYEFSNDNLLHRYTITVKKFNAPKHIVSNKYIVVFFAENGINKSKTIQWFQNAPFYVPLIYNKGLGSYFVNIISSGVLVGSSNSNFGNKSMNEYGISANWNANESEFWFTHRDSSYHYQTQRTYGTSDLYVVNNINRLHTIYQKRFDLYENLTSGSKVELKDSTYCLFNDLLKQPAYYSYRGLGLSGITEINIFGNKSTQPQTRYTIDRGTKVINYVPGMKIIERIKKYDFSTKLTDTTSRTVIFN